MYPKRIFFSLLRTTGILLLPWFACAQIEDAVIEDKPRPIDTNRAFQKNEPKRIGITGQYGFALGDSLLVSPEFYELPYKYSDFMVAARQKGLYGIIDKRGKTLHPFEYEAAGGIVGLIFLSKKGLQRYFDSSGKLLFETHFDAVDQNLTNKIGHENWLVVQQGMLKGIVDREAKSLFPFKYPDIVWAAGQFVGVANEQGFCGLADWQGNEIIPSKYFKLEKPDENGRLAASIGENRSGLIDTSGQIVVPFEYSQCDNFWKIPQHYILKKNKHYGVVNASGKIIVPPELPYAPVHLPYSILRTEKEEGGRFIETQRAYTSGAFFTAALSATENALYHIERGLVLKVDYANFTIFNDNGPILASRPGHEIALFNIDGQVLLQGKYFSLFPNVFQTVFFARLPDNRYQLFDMNGQLLSNDFFNQFWNEGGQNLPYGFFALSDANDRFALFDPYGKRISPHQYISIKAVGESDHRIAQKKGYLKPGRVLVAKGMTEIPERQVIGWHWLDDTGTVVNE